VLDKQPRQVGLSLLFACGDRPSAGDIERVISTADSAAAAACVSYRPPEEAEGMVELLASGLTFDLRGLYPASAMPLPPKRHRYGTIDEMPGALEAITLVPSHHTSSGFAMIPVVQAMAALAADIALPLGTVAVCWHPAQSWMAPQYFSRIALSWISGGPFPALGLAALQENSNGLRTEGLGFFIAQELQLDGLAGEPRQEIAKRAVRLIDLAVYQGGFHADGLIEGPDGLSLAVEIRDAGKLARLRPLA